MSSIHFHGCNALPALDPSSLTLSHSDSLSGEVWHDAVDRLPSDLGDGRLITNSKGDVTELYRGFCQSSERSQIPQGDFDVLREHARVASQSATLIGAWIKVEPYVPVNGLREIDDGSKRRFLDLSNSIPFNAEDTITISEDSLSKFMGRIEFRRRDEVIRLQFEEIKRRNGWSKQIAQIAQRRRIARQVVERAGLLFGGKEYFPAFENHRTILSELEELENKQPTLYQDWLKYVGKGAFEKQIKLIKILSKTKGQNIPPELLSAWQMQGLDVPRMLHMLNFMIEGNKLGKVDLSRTSEKLRDQQAIQRLFYVPIGDEEAWHTAMIHYEELSKISTKFSLQVAQAREIVEMDLAQPSLSRVRRRLNKIKDGLKDRMDSSIGQLLMIWYLKNLS